MKRWIENARASSKERRGTRVFPKDPTPSSDGAPRATTARAVGLAALLLCLAGVRAQSLLGAGFALDTVLRNTTPHAYEKP